MIRVTVWNEFLHEKDMKEAMELYPNGIHATIKEFLDKSGEFEVRLAALDDPDQGLPESVLESTDVLVWWGHMAHQRVDDALVERIRQRVYNGMGFVALHSAHHSKPFKAILGTTGNLAWGREQKAIVWNLMPSHPIAAGIPAHFELYEEMYGEPFFIPTPEELIFGTWYEDGNILRGGCTWRRGLGKIFYFHPGHEICPSFHNEYVQRIIKQGIEWAAPVSVSEDLKNVCTHQTEAPASK